MVTPNWPYYTRPVQYHLAWIIWGIVAVAALAYGPDPYWLRITIGALGLGLVVAVMLCPSDAPTTIRFVLAMLFGTAYVGAGIGALVDEDTFISTAGMTSFALAGGLLGLLATLVLLRGLRSSAARWKVAVPASIIGAGAVPASIFLLTLAWYLLSIIGPPSLLVVAVVGGLLVGWLALLLSLACDLVVEA